MKFDICWSKGIRLCFPQIKGIDDNLIEFDNELIERLRRCDYLSFNDFFNSADKLIANTVNKLINKCQSPKDAILQLVGGQQDHGGKGKQNTGHGNKGNKNHKNSNNKHNNSNNNNNNDKNHNRRNNNGNNGSGNGNTGGGRGGGSGGGGHGGDDGDEKKDDRSNTGKNKKTSQSEEEEDSDSGSESNAESDTDDNAERSDNHPTLLGQKMTDFDACFDPPSHLHRSNSCLNRNSLSTEFSTSPLPQQVGLQNWDVGAKSFSSVDKHYGQAARAQQRDPTPLRDIMICRGICNCSGQCGNGLILGAILFYHSLIKGESKGGLDHRWFNKYTNTTVYNSKMWTELLNVFDNTKTKWSQEWLVDLLCLIDIMTESLPDKMYYNPFSTEAWPDPVNRTGTIYEKVERLFERARKEQRREKIKRWVCQMFAEYRKYYEHGYKKTGLNHGGSSEEKHDEKIDDANINSNGSKNNYNRNRNNKNNKNKNNNSSKNNGGDKGFSSRYVKFVFNRLFRAICVHSYAMIDGYNDYVGMMDYSVNVNVSLSMPRIVMNDNSTRSSKQSQKEERKRNDKINNQVLKQFGSETRQEFSVKTMLTMISDIRSDASDFDAMRLLIITMKFLIECETSFDLNIKCIKPYTLKNIINHKKFRDIQYIQRLANETKGIYESPRNYVGKQKKLLTKEMIEAIRLYTIEPVCRHMKKAHFNADTCQYRDLCQYVLLGLKRLKNHDRKDFNIRRYPRLYCGLKDVSFDQDSFTTTFEPLLQKLGKSTKTNPNRAPENPLEFTIPWYSLMSTTPDRQVASNFSEYEQKTNSSIVFRILKENLGATDNVLYGDITWISIYDDREGEVLFGPCLLHAIDNKEFLDTNINQRQNSRNRTSSKHCRSNGNNYRVKCKNSSKKPMARIDEFKETTQLIKVRPKPIQHVRKLLNDTWNYSSRTNSVSVSVSGYSNTGNDTVINYHRGFFGNSGDDMKEYSTNTNTRLSQSQTSHVSYRSESSGSNLARLKSMSVSSSYDADHKKLTEWIDKLFGKKKSDQQRKTMVDAFENSDFNNMDAIYGGLTYNMLEKALKITSIYDKDKIMFSVLEHYMPNNDLTKLKSHQQIVYRLLKANVGQPSKEKRIKRYFMILMQEYGGCAPKYIKRLDEDILDKLGIGTTMMEKGDIVEAIKAANFDEKEA